MRPARDGRLRVFVETAPARLRAVVESPARERPGRQRLLSSRHAKSRLPAKDRSGRDAGVAEVASSSCAARGCAARDAISYRQWRQSIGPLLRAVASEIRGALLRWLRRKEPTRRIPRWPVVLRLRAYETRSPATEAAACHRVSP